jgi:DNA-binding winged helix-turn-helix (wHTH) protein
VCFDVFEVDLRSAELRKPGSKLRLQDKPFQILTLLLEHPGDVVTREQLRRRLWPNGIVVDFEHNINAAVNRLREALGDEAEHPRFIETLPRRGYRFITPVSHRRLL